MNKKILVCSISFLVLILLNQVVYALGVTPSRITLNFEPNLEVTKRACIIPGGTKAVDIYIKGELAPYITFSEDKLTFSKDEQKCVTYTLSLPSTLIPGTNAATIYARQSSVASVGGTGMSARAGVGQQIWVKVPYPGKYLIASLSAGDVATGEPVEFTISLDSKGKEVISKVSGSIEVINQNNESLGLLSTTEITNFKSATKATLSATWAPSSGDVGTYTAIATINYDGKTAESRTSFKLGELTLKLVNVTNLPIEKDKIGKIDILIESVWISPISDVHAEVKSAGKTVKSESIDISPWSKRTIPIYFPTQDIEVGEYPAIATVYYADKTVEKAFIITVFEDKTMFYFVAGGSAVFVILIAVLVIFFIKQRRFKRRMQHAMYLPQ